MQNLVDYKEKVASKYIPIEGNDAARDLPESDDYYYSEKIDGNLAIAIVTPDKVTFFNRSGTEISLPNLEASFPKDALGIWAGELYIGDERSHFYEVKSAITNNKDRLKFAIFDAVHSLDLPIHERIKIVLNTIKENTHIHPVHWNKATSKKELLDAYNKMVEEGKEGMVFHNSIGRTFKVKPSFNIDLTVLGYNLKEDGSAMRSLLVGVYYNDEWLVLGSVGGGFNELDRINWMTKLAAIETNADFVMIASNRMAYKWVKPEFVIQVKCLELLNEDSSGTVYKDNVKYDPEIGYKSMGKVPGVSMYAPVFVGIREDKKPGEFDTGINQITDRVELLKDDKPDLEELKDSEIILREVYTKNSKTGTAVRKFLGVKTNKTMEQGFSPYFLYYTDFSAGRKEPLQIELKLASSEIKLRELFSNAIEENVKKGWDKIGM